MMSSEPQQGAWSRRWDRIRRSWTWATTAKVGVVLVFLIVDIVLFFGLGRGSDSGSAASPDPTNVRTAISPYRVAGTVLDRTRASRTERPAARASTSARATGATTGPAKTSVPSRSGTSGRVTALKSPATTASVPSAQTTGAPAPSTTTSASAPSPAPTSGPSQVPRSSTADAGIPDSGPGIDEPGLLLVAVPDATGSFEVTERLRLAQPTATLALAPPDISRAGSIFRSADVTATDVQISAGDQPVVVPATVVQAVTVAAAGNRFTLRYRLDGVTVRSRPSTAARAIAAIGPMSSQLPPDLPVVVIVSGPTVLAIDCPLQPLAEQSCGVGGAPRWTVAAPLRARAALTTVQFDLPVD
jgi:hypothetical protein